MLASFSNTIIFRHRYFFIDPKPGNSKYEKIFIEISPWWASGIAVAAIAIFIPFFVRQFMGASGSFIGMYSLISANPFFHSGAARDRGRLTSGFGIVGGAAPKTLPAPGNRGLTVHYGMIENLLAE